MNHAVHYRIGAEPQRETVAGLDALRTEIERSWRSKKTGVELVREGRR